MRFIFKFSFPPEKFNQAVLDGTSGEKIAQILDETKPEAAYFFAEGGRRGGLENCQMAILVCRNHS